MGQRAQAAGCGTAMALLLLAGAATAAGRVELISRASVPGSLPADGDSFGGVMSADGRYVAFATRARNLGPVDGTDFADIVLRDRSLGTLTLVSRTAAAQGNGDSFNASLSADGATLAFESTASNLVAGDVNGVGDIFVFDRIAGSLRRLTPAAGVEPNGPSSMPKLASGGGRVLFVSSASNWVAGDSNGVADLFVYDLASNLVTRASLDAAGAQLTTRVDSILDYTGVFATAISGDGRCVAWDTDTALVPTDSNGLADVYVRDLVAGTTLRASVGAAGTQVDTNDSTTPAFGPDCSSVLFSGGDNTLDGSSAAQPFFAIRSKLLLPAPGAVTRVWPTASNTNADVFLSSFALSPNGAWIACDCRDTPRPPLVALARGPSSMVERGSGAITLVPGPGAAPTAASNDGAFGLFESFNSFGVDDLNGENDVALLSRAAGSHSLQSQPLLPVVSSTAANGASGLGPDSTLATNGSTRNQFISADGVTVLFSSQASNLVAGDGNGVEDLFVANRRSGAVQRLSVPNAGGEANGVSAVSDLSPDGRYVVFESCATNLVAGDGNGICDLFVADRAAPSNPIQRANVSSAGAEANGGGEPQQGHWGSISADGCLIAFASAASNLVVGDGNNQIDLFLRDRCASPPTTTRAYASPSTPTATSPNPAPPNRFRVINPRLSANGRYVVFRTNAWNIPGDGSGRAKIALVDLSSGSTELIDRNLDGASTAELAFSSRPFVSGDGRFVAFTSTGSSLVVGDTNNAEDVFLRDRLLGKTTRASLTPSGGQVGTGNYLGGISADGTLLPFCANPVGQAGVCLAGFAYNTGTGRVDEMFPAATDASQLLRLQSSADGRFVAFSSDSRNVVAADGNGAVRDVFVVSEFASRTSTGTAGVAPELALSDGDAGDLAGSALAVSDRFVVVGAPNADGGAAGSGSVYVFARPSAVQLAEMVAAIGTDGYKSAKSLTLIGELTQAGATPGDKWGSAVSITPDGSQIVVGVPGDNGGSGSVVVFNQPATGWSTDSSPDDVILPPAVPNTAPGGFGSAIDLGDDGSLLIGAPGTDVGSAGDAGMAALYAPSGAGYAEAPSASFVPAAPQTGAGYGTDVAVGGALLAIGAPLQDDAGNVDEGAVYTFTMAQNGSVAPGPTLMPPDGGAPGDKWGMAVGAGGGAIVVGAPGADTAAGQDSGAGYVYQGSGGTLPAVPAELLPGPNAGGHAGMSVDAGNGYVALGSPDSARDGVAGTGTAFVYEQPESGWRPGTVVAFDIEVIASERQAEQGFGGAVALSPQGVLVGAPERDVQSGATARNADQGEADTFVFDRILRSGLE